MSETVKSETLHLPDFPTDRQVKALQHFQHRINEITEERNAALERIEDAKKHLTHLVDHWDEYSQGRLRNEITGIVSEVL